MSLLISVDGGIAASTHRPFISGQSSYDKVTRNLPRLVSWTHEAVVRTTYHPDSLDLVGNVRHLLDIGAPSIALCPVIEAQWTGHEERLASAWEAIADLYIDEARSGHILPLDVTHMLIRGWQNHKLGGARPSRPCGVGSWLIGIDPDGNVMPCHRFLYRKQDWLGTVDDTTMNSVKRQPFLHLVSTAVLGCDTCAAEPVCGGGCRSVVVDIGADLATGTHPGHCLTTRAHAKAARRIYDTLTVERNKWFLAMLRGPSKRLAQAAFTELINR